MFFLNSLCAFPAEAITSAKPSKVGDLGNLV